jgi:F-type H+-transporting ATPase subunit gamma
VVEFMVLRALFEQAASEHGARMTAMDSATENTRELIRSLTLDMNKARQAQITTELTEIVAGSEAL